MKNWYEFNCLIKFYSGKWNQGNGPRKENEMAEDSALKNMNHGIDFGYLKKKENSNLISNGSC